MTDLSPSSTGIYHEERFWYARTRMPPGPFRYLRIQRNHGGISDGRIAPTLVRPLPNVGCQFTRFFLHPSVLHALLLRSGEREGLRPPRMLPPDFDIPLAAALAVVQGRNCMQVER